MSDCINVVHFNKDKIRLVMRFEGDNYETATVNFSLNTVDGRPKLEEDVTIPVKCLFSMGYLILMSIRRTAVQYETEVMEMQKIIKKGQHPFKQIGEKKDVKKDQAKTNRGAIR